MAYVATAGVHPVYLLTGKSPRNNLGTSRGGCPSCAVLVQTCVSAGQIVPPAGFEPATPALPVTLNIRFGRIRSRWARWPSSGVRLGRAPYRTALMFSRITLTFSWIRQPATTPGYARECIGQMRLWQIAQNAALSHAERWRRATIFVATGNPPYSIPPYS